MFKKEEKVPDEILTLLAKKFFENYGGALADMINRKIVQQLEPVVKDVDVLKTEVKGLKSMSDSKTRELLRTTLEVGMETISEKSAKKAVELIGLDRIETIMDAVNMLKESQMELSESLEKVSDVISEIQGVLRNVSEISKEFTEEIEKSISQFGEELKSFRTKVSKATDEAIDNIRKNVVIDEGLIESIVSRKLTTLVDTKFEDVLMKVEGLSGRVESLEKTVGGLREIEDSVNVLSEKIDEIKELIKSASIEREDLQQRVSEAKLEQDAEEYPLIE